jgi:hypothetical protein
VPESLVNEKLWFSNKRANGGSPNPVTMQKIALAAGVCRYFAFHRFICQTESWDQSPTTHF